MVLSGCASAGASLGPGGDSTGAQERLGPAGTGVSCPRSRPRLGLTVSAQHFLFSGCKTRDASCAGVFAGGPVTAPAGTPVRLHRAPPARVTLLPGGPSAPSSGPRGRKRPACMSGSRSAGAGRAREPEQPSRRVGGPRGHSRTWGACNACGFWASLPRVARCLGGLLFPTVPCCLFFPPFGSCDYLGLGR